MKNTLLGGVLLLSTWGGLTRIHNRNEAIRKGAAAYARKEYAVAAAAYKTAAVTLGSREEVVWLNLAHATAQAGQPGAARGYYSRLVTSKTPNIRSVALQQLAALAAAQNDHVQAVGLLRQALVANPANQDARYNYEALRNFLSRRAAAPQAPAPGTDGGPQDSESASSAPRAGTDQLGNLADPTQPQNPNSVAQSKADPNGQRDPNQPSATAGSTANQGFRPGPGQQRSVAKGSEPGSVRGLSDAESGPEAPGGTSRRGGTEAATNAEANTQTQRARLQQMNLSPGQARQLLEALHTAEQQYLQQLPRKATTPAPKGKPGW
ncbi:hypothetical protein [Hymenobacter glacieicola]|uniref:Tetratricopeptide repeat protein n=1 Tax=Hymenobacter glacieicola TaxID=1562124 RepID=A0ABQ1WQG8_9BACT|nr:hypothetical protein [Hymenobacter glacieicola]GGG42348.1 hypothetical protein GCM10011378_18390 [Hymenobacter glacieicola]